MSIQDHLDDIDFRTKEERQKAFKEDFLGWWENLCTYLDENGWDDRIGGQKDMLQSVLWYVLSDKEYKAALKFKPKQKTLL